MKNLITFLIITFTLISQGRELPFKAVDSVYSELIRSVQLFPVSNTIQDYPAPPVASIITQNLVLYFDELGEEASNFNAAIYHCNADWTQSDVRELDYLSDYNEFTLDQGELSFNTRIAYTHYRFRIPRVKYSGNYILVIYRDFDPSDIVITRRFSIFQKTIEVEAKGSVMARGSQQGIDFSIYHRDVNITNPLNSITAIVRKNGITQETSKPLEPTFIKAEQIEYNAISTKAIFSGGNEYRRFDMRSTEFNGFNINKVNKEVTPIAAYIYPDEKRGSGSYQEDQDINGHYVIDHYEFDQGETQSDYLNIYFRLNTYKHTKDIYVYGALTNWKISEEFKMRWDEAEQFYYCRPLLKQGYYNYQYVIVENGKIKPEPLEGSYPYTENSYEVLIYHRNLNGLYDKLIGYHRFTLYPRR